ncbi:phenylalanine--tRNA ligase subunit beta [Phycicoccus endophyticus]|uniref:Phenylalanine--tRNA ligase beta subunit n=1 Tax=Phycicoccus endophyticus TaxID=1690220 RepID=A0A7G9R441_9MICO|nr:phenylalanine--tRNA ligase subunit beta [Phycicoccus endophyticus]NHI18209.1 phenylalanine--tRNA ligase subunit beta [Phycicoccus endophyticus]QNN50366.1 phenylalanine--tRNA ligase subunit beta [Phycicoccus endophyticus]GGL25599.1 phenylalanine--tRNA ligase beta subunit [Phycicoccus endophyticus]
MRVPVDWLREYVEVPSEATGQDIAAALVSVGLEEEAVHTGGVRGPLVVGRVLTMEPEAHKNGKTVNWCSVDVGAANGTGEPQGIVCGAHNFAPGDHVVVVLPGGVLPTPDGPLEVSARRTYGHVSAGMICSERELGLGEDHDGILVLERRYAEDPDALARCVPGADALALLGLDRETVEVNVTPDRGYCFSVRGVAREYAHASGATFTDPVQALAAAAPGPTASGYPVRVADDAPVRGRAGCDRFGARVVRGLDVAAPTPQWMRTRLTEAGMRPISLAVDVTNYVMLGLGQPLHAYDLATLGSEIVVRRARPGERLRTLDDVERTLDPQDLLITDGGETPLGLAGVMGGASTEVSGATTDVLLEAAHFDPVTIARSARRHRLPSEASRRFERGVDPALGPAALQLAVELLVRYGGGEAGEEVTDVGSPQPPAPVAMDVDFPSRLVGVDYARGTVVSVLEAIGCAVDGHADRLTVTPPSWRPDLRTAEDLVEEVARIHGYARIPSVLPTPPGGSGLSHAQRVRRTVADVLAARGLFEVWGAPFVGEDRLAALGLDVAAETARTVRVANPLSDEQPWMRPSLLATLVDALRRNVSRGAKDVALFEVGLVTALDGPQRAAPTVEVGVLPPPETLAAIREAVPPQPRHLAVLLTGELDRAGWWGPGRRADLGDVLELVDALAEALAVETVVTADDVMPWHPGRCARVALADGTVLGHVGELHPTVVQALGLPPRTVGGELDLDALTVAADHPVRARTLATYPMAQSDVALVVDRAVPAAAVRGSLVAGGGDLLEAVQLFDVFEGEQVGAGRKSLAYRLTFRSPERTLTTEEVSGLRDAAVAAAARDHGAVQRA